jgi:hypothetical protein
MKPPPVFFTQSPLAPSIAGYAVSPGGSRVWKEAICSSGSQYGYLSVHDFGWSQSRGLPGWKVLPRPVVV